MILKESLKKVVKEQRMNIESADQGIIREVLSGIDVDIPFAHIISGIRRSGKSTLLRQLLSKLPNFYYLNFEDTRLQSFETSDFEKLVEIFAEEFGESKFYLFDEIQNVQNWEIFVRSGLDRDRRFLITGSNASMLSSELGTRLTGRHLNTELFPFSYKEVISIKNETPGPESFKNYLTEGGFPEYVKNCKSEILRELLNDIIQRDIVARYKISSSKILFEMAIYLLTNSGKEFTYNALKKTFGLGSVNTAI
ncbi:MAG: ATP-binding protein, partial [Thermoplasmataceae archaeon]